MLKVVASTRTSSRVKQRDGRKISQNYSPGKPVSGNPDMRPSTFGLAYQTDGVLKDEIFPDSAEAVELIVVDYQDVLDFKVDAIAGSPSKPVKPVDSDLQPVIVQVDNPAAADDDPDVFLCRKCPFVSLKEDDLKRHFTDEHQSENVISEEKSKKEKQSKSSKTKSPKKTKIKAKSSTEKTSSSSSSPKKKKKQKNGEVSATDDPSDKTNKIVTQLIRMRTNGKKYKITVKSFKSGLKKFVCETCGKNYKTMNILRMHIKDAHILLSNFECKVCFKKFFTSSGLNHHVLADHLGVKNEHMCGDCGKMFDRQSSLKQHVDEVHLKLRNHVCKICHKTTVHEGHKISHEDRIECDKCGKDFYNKWTLSKHDREVHQKLKSWKCDECDEAFVRSGHLKKHEEKVHAKVE